MTKRRGKQRCSAKCSIFFRGISLAQAGAEGEEKRGKKSKQGGDGESRLGEASASREEEEGKQEEEAERCERIGLLATTTTAGDACPRLFLLLIALAFFNRASIGFGLYRLFGECCLFGGGLFAGAFARNLFVALGGLERISTDALDAGCAVLATDARAGIFEAGFFFTKALEFAKPRTLAGISGNTRTIDATLALLALYA